MLKKYESLARKSEDCNVQKINYDKPSQEESLKLTNNTKRLLEEKLSKKINSKGVNI
jgi:hypothetical protein